LEFSVFISTAFAQTAPAAAASGGMESSLMSMLPLVLMFVVLYFVMIRPQMKKQKEHRSMIDALAKGDEIVTAGGILGKVSKLGESYVSVELAQGLEVQMQRSAVVHRQVSHALIQPTLRAQGRAPSGKPSSSPFRLLNREKPAV
jgi:preprotein translocase subunit YajC